MDALVLAQIDEAAELARFDWTLASFAIFVWLATCGFFIWLLIRKDRAITDLAQDNRTLSKARAEDLQKQVTARGEDVTRVETGLQSAAAATTALQTEFRELRGRIDVVLSRSGG